MGDAWFLDMANVDIELAVSQAMSYLPTGVLTNVRQKLLQLLYFQAARMSLNRQSPYLLWLFLRRVMAVGGVTDDVLLKCEYHFSHDFLIDRITTILKDAKFRSIYYSDDEAVSIVIDELSRKLSEIGFKKANGNLNVDEGSLLIAANLDDSYVSSGTFSHVIVLSELFQQIRLTQRPCQLKRNEKRVLVSYLNSTDYESLNTPSHAFNIICAPYSEMA